jgi:hypothetical protein
MTAVSAQSCCRVFICAQKRVCCLDYGTQRRPTAKWIAVPVPGWYWSTSPTSIASDNVTIGSNSTERVTVVNRRMLQQADGSTSGGGVLAAYAADAAGGFSGGYWDQHQDEGHVEPCPADGW